MNGTKEKMIRRSFLETCCVVFLYLITIILNFQKTKRLLKTLMAIIRIDEKESRNSVCCILYTKYNIQNTMRRFVSL